jgi:sterol desaturase/sphingolipid hydroxylase (fatty acid hydroxylase superfamily)
MIGQHAYTVLIELARLCVWLLILSVLFVPLERLFSLNKQPVFRKAIALDLGYYFLGSVVPALVLSAPLGVVAWGAHRLMPGDVVAAIANLPIWLRAALAMVVGETGFYWGHRWTHEIPLLWRFHAIHHSATQLDFLVSSRAHPVDMVFTRLCGLIPLYVLGLAGPLGSSGSAIAVAVLLVGSMWGFFIHANLRWRFGPLEWLISSPAFHHWHHTLTGPVNHNYAPMLPWLDAVFGTLHLPRGQWPTQYGTDTPVAGSLAAQLVQPFAPPPEAPAAVPATVRQDARPV